VSLISCDKKPKRVWIAEKKSNFLSAKKANIKRKEECLSFGIYGAKSTQSQTSRFKREMTLQTKVENVKNHPKA